MKENVEKSAKEPHKAIELSNSLGGTPLQRAEEDKTLFLKFAPGVRAEVTFTGQWSGRLVRAAFNAISKGYRRRRHTYITRPELKVEPTKIKVEKPKEVKGDGISKVS